MARSPRIFCESQNYHVILRGNNKQVLFCDEDDNIFFLKRLKKYASELNISIFSYCLMSNHVHILVGNANPTLSKFVQKLATSYAMRFNRKYGRTGHLFEGRFKSEPVENEEYFKTVCRYILQNPQKAGIVDFATYKWSSYLSTVQEDKQTFVKRDYLFDLFETKKTFTDFVNQTETKECMEYEGKRYYSDYYCIQIIKETLGFPSPSIIASLEKEELVKNIRILKKKGFSINQISRVTGIPRKIIKES